MGTPKTRSEARRQKRRQLEALGYSPARVEAAVVDYERRNGHRNEAQERQARLVEQEADLDAAMRAKRRAGDWSPPDDKGYRPTQVDSVLTGVARATGQTAAAAKRRSTMTAAQYHRWKA